MDGYKTKLPVNPPVARPEDSCAEVEEIAPLVVKLVPVATPNTGVTSVGDVASTTDPEPVTALPSTEIVPLASGSVHVRNALVTALTKTLWWSAKLFTGVILNDPLEAVTDGILKVPDSPVAPRTMEAAASIVAASVPPPSPCELTENLPPDAEDIPAVTQPGLLEWEWPYISNDPPNPAEPPPAWRTSAPVYVEVALPIMMYLNPAATGVRLRL